MTEGQARWCRGWWLLVVLCTCGKPPHAPDAGPLLDAAQFCTEFRLAFAESFVRCGLYSPGWGEERRAEASLPCKFDSQLRFDPEKARECLTALAASCSDLTACVDTAVGTLGSGSSCFDSECEPGLFCDASQTCPGTCAPLVPVGQPATGPCEHGAAPFQGVCTRRLEVGASCASPDGSSDRPSCVAGAVCSNDERCVLASRADAGAYCDPGLGLFCADGLQCSGDGCLPLAQPGQACRGLLCQYDLTCTADLLCLAPAALGEICTSPVPGGAPTCRSQYFCGFSYGASDGTCLPLLEANAACAVHGQQCGLTLTCLPDDSTGSWGTCQARGQRGAPCTERGEANGCDDGLFCTAGPSTEGVCADQNSGGRKCRAARECQSFQCNADGRCGPACQPPPP